MARRGMPALVLVAALAACSAAGSEAGSEVPATTPSSATASSAPASTIVLAPTTVPAPTTTAPPSTTAAVPTTAPDPQLIEKVELGRSVEGRPLTAVRRGTPGGTVVLVVGAIHGNEDAGVAVVDRLARAEVPAGIDLWLVPSMNPDGQANRTRGNANGVDLNRNFPYRWAPLAQPGDWQYGGPAAASEPETRAMVELISRIQPDLGIWYHQDLFRIAPATGEAGRIRRRYAELTGLPVLPITGGSYTGVAATWQRQAVPGGVAFVVELGPTLGPAEADTHAAAVLTVAR